MPETCNTNESYERHVENLSRKKKKKTLASN